MIIHKELTDARWFGFSLAEQLANVGSDVIRAINWKKKGNLELSQQAFWRALELINLTQLDPKYRKTPKLKEIGRIKETLIDYFMYDNIYGSSDELWEHYFMYFNYLAAVQRGR